MSPKKFKISESFDSNTRKLLEEVVPKTDLPEGVSIVRAGEAAEKPFAVVSPRMTVKEALEEYRRGALRYAPMIADPEVLQEKLSSNKEIE